MVIILTTIIIATAIITNSATLLDLLLAEAMTITSNISPDKLISEGVLLVSLFGHGTEVHKESCFSGLA